MLSLTGENISSTLFEEFNDNWKLVIKSLNEEVKLKKVVTSKSKKNDAYQRIKVKMNTRVHIGQEGDKTFTPPDKKVKREIRTDCDKNFISKVKLSLPQIKS